MTPLKKLTHKATRSALGLMVMLFTLTVFTLPAHAFDKINTSYFGNLAVDGYDTVAYFTENKAVEGSKKFQTQWQGANWRFSNQKNLTAFKQEPQRYAPQYGGYCAFAMAHNDTASIEPEQFTIVDGKLYLNYNRNIKEEWLDERDEMIKKADKHWAKKLK